jgi:hypothetical protein
VKELVTVIGLACAIAVGSAVQKSEPQNGSSKSDKTSFGTGQAASPNKIQRADYIGDAGCRACHSEKVETFRRTAHYLTSRMPDKDSILGNFNPPENVMKTVNPELTFRMEAKGGEFFQTAVEGEGAGASTRSEKFGVVIGSGGKGQTYLYWKGDLLFQMPVSYWREMGWVNSPGYVDGEANFERGIIPRCLECHATYIEAAPPPGNRFHREGLITGITCEKCHGPGRAHVEWAKRKPAASGDEGILNPAKFERARQMDLCGWCHAGHGRPLQAWFSYQPGELLNKYIEMAPPDPNAAVDVHGSQVELLEKSRCFAASSMTCLTCHDVHQTQHDRGAFSQKCLGCHKEESCGMFAKKGHAIASDCVDCHMPEQETNLILFDENGKKARPLVRNHWIKVYGVGK